MGYVVFIEENCIVYTDGTSCGACSEHCPTQAVAMVPYKDGLTIPHVNKEICVGCGGCEYVCPARPFRAIYIEGNPVQKEAKPFKENEEHKVEIDDFGFYSVNSAGAKDSIRIFVLYCDIFKCG